METVHESAVDAWWGHALGQEWCLIEAAKNDSAADRKRHPL